MTGNAPTTASPALRRGLLLAVALFLAWQVITLQVANHYARNADAGDAAAAARALGWDPGQPRALELQARILLADATEDTLPQRAPEAQALLERAVTAEPSRGNNLALLALLRQREHDGSAPVLASLADELAPVHPQVQRNLARYYLLATELDQAVVHAARAMVGKPGLASDYYPLLMQVAADPRARDVLAAIADDPTPFPWWQGFFRHVATNAQELDALRSLVSLRQASTALPLTEYERNLYINRLRREGLVDEAYLHWVNGLGKAQLRSLGYLYDGGFDHDFANDSGFGWVARPPGNSGIRISRGDTYGASNDKALRLSFRGKRVRFSHVYQQVFLAPGAYTVSGRVRPDQLRARRGLQWRLYCSTGAGGTLGESELFVGTGDWRSFQFEVVVPPECSGQTLRLYSAGHRDVDHELDGAIWFDDLQIGLDK
ncbi:hypothetical protein E2F43_15000 [Seongchinamella unica]|uniref:CBM-cenC domain-containing protein n=1 Tax=Seongchinamella unica TaxID=2547392 RepID=A0A4R5LQJ4_9GAMM|nr:hypothetical protein [Seongchinamella unica]TDG12864.1 hypothetical protein E2F43_15000 [Seongchinamella unica]